MKKRILVLISIMVLILMSFSFAAIKIEHYCWQRGPYYSVKNNVDVWGRYSGCRHYRDSWYTGHSFDTLDYDLYVKAPSGTESVLGKVGFESGTTMLIDSHFGFKNIINGTSRIYGISDRIKYKQTALTGSFSTANKYELKANDFTENDYTLRGIMKDTYPGREIEKSTSFYVGPYPTVSCKVNLFDDNNKNTHYDSIQITDIKLKSTYKPSKLIFEICKNNTFINSFTATVNSANSYSTGWNSTFNNIEKVPVKTSGINLKPGEQINIRVKVVDGRGTGTANPTNPNSPKYAKYSNSPVF